MTMKRYTGKKIVGAFIDPVPAAIMKAKAMHADDPLNAHYCVLQSRDSVQVVRHVDSRWQVLYSTRGENEKKEYLRVKYH